MSYDLIAFIISCLLVLIYYFCLGRWIKRSPDSSMRVLNAKIRERWVRMVMQSDKMDILAIQTLRNSVMAANFMASTAVLLIIGTLNLSEKIEHWALDWHPFMVTYTVASGLWQIKLSLLLLDFFITFYCFSMGIRFFNHVGYMINLSREATVDEVLYKQTCAYLNRAGEYYTYGTRAFFFSLPIISWFFGPYFLIFATVGLISVLVMLDRAPS